MSISAAFSSALSGLAANSRAASAVSNNIANATTEGYGARSVVRSSIVAGGAVAGVQIAEVLRQSNPVLIGQRRLADADLGQSDARAAFLARLEAQIGTPEAEGSLAAHLDRFEESLIAAGNRPDSEAALSGILHAAHGLSGKLNAVSDDIQLMRGQADSEIATTVDRLNTTLAELERLNDQIQTANGIGGDPNAYLDRQQVLVDEIADHIPVKEYRNQNGTLRLYSEDGIALLDGRASQFDFQPTPIITPDLRVGGALSDLTVNGRAIPQNGSEPGLSGGRLRALFEIRDELAIDAQTRLDAVARDLAERFEDPALDTTRAATDPGLFTDEGLLSDPLNEEGLAQRIAINALVDPDRGGAVWRLRDGLGAAAPGAVGDATLIQGMIGALADTRVTASGGFTPAARSLTFLGGELLSTVAGDRQAADSDRAFAAARHATLRDAELAEGVNTDAELQQMLMIEKMFMANARLIEIAGQMLQEVMRIGR